jgi:MYXO-CTERM domain-containing protein
MILRWEWYFGDGTTAVGRQVAKTFEYGGSYDVTLRVVDNQGGTATTTHSITVTGPAAPAPACDPGMPPTTGVDAGAADAGTGGATGTGGAAGSLPDGSVVLPDGAIRLPDGAVIVPPQADAGDAGVSSNSGDDSGCGCKVARSVSSETAIGAVVALLGLALRRRRAR